MNTEQQRAAFEAWFKGTDRYLSNLDFYLMPDGKYEDDVEATFEAYQAGRAALQSQDREDAERYRYLITKLQQVYDGDYFETALMRLYCHMTSQFKGDRVVRAEITWRDKTDEPIGLSAAIDHARRIEGGGE